MTVPAAATVVVPTRDRPEHLARCLAALDAQRGRDFDVVVVDDASVDEGAVRAAVGDRSGVHLVRGRGAGPAAARNLGARQANGSVLCFTDDDCRPGPGWVAALLARVDAGAVAVAGPTRNGRPRDRFATASQAVTNHLADASRRASSGGAPFAPTSNLAVRADVFAALPFDESFPLAAGEDREWCDRLAASGHVLAHEPAAWVSHHQDLGWRGFWRQQLRYGRGAHHLRHRPGSGDGGLQPARFYVDLLRTGFARGPGVGVLVIVAQAATAVGIVQGMSAARRR